MKVSEETEVSVPLRSLIAAGVALSLFVAQYFMLTHRIQELERDSLAHAAEIDRTRKFRLEWSRGELGLLGIDISQNTRLDHSEKDIVELNKAIQRVMDILIKK